MSSGRDVMMDNWDNQVEQAEWSIRKSQEDQFQQRMITRMTEYRQTLITEIERIDNIIKELQQNEQ